MGGSSGEVADDNMDGPEQRYFGPAQSCSGRIPPRAIHKPELHNCTTSTWSGRRRGGRIRCGFGKSARLGLMRRMAGDVLTAATNRFRQASRRR